MSPISNNYINIWILSLLFVPVYFMDFDVSTFNPENMTDYQEDLKSLSVSPVEDWLKEILLMIIGHRSLTLLNTIWISLKLISQTITNVLSCTFAPQPPVGPPNSQFSGRTSPVNIV